MMTGSTEDSHHRLLERCARSEEFPLSSFAGVVSLKITCFGMWNTCADSKRCYFIVSMHILPFRTSTVASG